MGFFNPEDVEKADVDPFSLPVGRRVQTVITESKVDKIGKDEYPAWVVTFSKGKRSGDTIHFLGGKDAEAEERNQGRIHQTLQLLEIPREDWDEVAERPDIIVGTAALVDVYVDKGGYRRVRLVGLDRSGITPSDDALDEFKNDDSGTELADDVVNY